MLAKSTIAAGLVALTVGALVAACAPASPSTGSASPSVQGQTDPRAGWPARLRLGFFGGDDAEKALRDQRPLTQFLQERLGIPIEVSTGTSYSAVIEAMRAGRVDGMLVGPFAYVLAAQEANAEAIAINVEVRPVPGRTTVYDPNTPAAYYSVLFTRKGSGIATIEDLRGRTFAFVDPASASGNLVPRTRILQANINPDRDMRSTFAGSHPTAVLAVTGGRTDAGATFEGNLYTMADQGQIEFCGFPDGRIGVPRTAAQIRALYDQCPTGRIAMFAYSDPIPGTPFAMRRDLPETLKQAVREALLDMRNRPDLVGTYNGWFADAPAELGLRSLDQYYNGLREIARLLNLDLRELAR